jgi:serine/threonine protein kinase
MNNLSFNVNEESFIPSGAYIGDFEVQSFIISGGFSEVYLVKNKLTKEHFAMKIEKKNQKIKGLSKEISILKKLPSSSCFPKLVKSGTTPKFSFLIQELLGPSLWTIKRQLPSLKFSLYSTLYLSLEMLNCIEEFHKAGFVHRDIKTGNFLLRPNMHNSICLIDFGLSFSYIDKQTGNHIPCSEVKDFDGTISKASPNAHKGITLSRRDDLISWFYTIMEMIDGYLPWSEERDFNVIGKMKNNILSEGLCSSLPSIFSNIYQYILNLKFEETPDYQYIKSGITNVLFSLKKHQFDWDKISTFNWEEISYLPKESNDSVGERNSLSPRERSQCCYVS